MNSWLAKLLFRLAVRLDPGVARRSRLVALDASEPVMLGEPKIDPRHVPAD